VVVVDEASLLLSLLLLLLLAAVAALYSERAGTSKRKYPRKYNVLIIEINKVRMKSIQIIWNGK